jgi:glycosyltransferase involved in cell wall biosynthesis
MTPAQPLVSVGVPVYNGERYLADALDSLLAQTFEDFEIIISDNASTDRTEQIARDYAAQDARVRYVRHSKNLGATGNFRRSFELSRGTYFRWAAADDLSAPQSLDRCVEVLDREPGVVLTYPKTKFIDENGRITAEYDDRLHIQCARASERFSQVVDRLRRCNAMYGLMRADVLKRTGSLGDFLAADEVFLAELSLYGTFWEIPEFLFYRRFHPAASTAMDGAQLKVFYDPAAPQRIVLRQWRHLGEYLRAVERAPLGGAEKLRLRLYVARIAIGRRGVLARELLNASRQVFAGALR